MVTRLDYQRDAVEACFSVLIEIMTVLGKFRDHIVLIGGWVPYFLIGEKKHEHTGSLDIDLALDFKNISLPAYRSILQLLLERGYEQGAQPFIFFREVEASYGRSVTVHIDLLAGEYGGTGASHRTQKAQDVRPRKARGCDLVFEDYASIKVTGKMPDGAHNEIMLKIAKIVPFLVMKGMAMWDCFKEKHAYDIYFVLRNYPGGIKALVKQFKPVLENRLVQEGLGKIKKKFETVDSPGPVWVANFEVIENPDEKDLMQRDSFERINTLLDKLSIQSYED